MPIKTDTPSRNRWKKNWGYLVLLPLLLVAIAVTASATRAAVPVGSVVGATGTSATMVTGQSTRNDVSPPLRDMPQLPMVSRPEQELNRNPYTAIQRKDDPDKSIQNTFGVLAMPTPILNFDGIPFPGVSCNCAPPDTDGEVGATQYVQMVNEGYQVFNKNTGASILGPSSIVSLWAGLGGVCENNGHGDPIVLYDQLANRWLISQFAGVSVPTDECIAVSTTNDATGSYNRYDFHLGSNFFDYPHLGVWPDAYYMSDNVFNAAGTVFLGPQPFAFDRTAMLAGTPATFVTTAAALGASVDSFLPADLDGSNLPTNGAPESFVGFPGGGQYTTYHFHVDFGTPANSTWTTFATPPAAGFTQLCPSTRACVPQGGTADRLDGIGDRPMFRLAYRKFGDGHESVVGNFSVSAGGVSGVRWFELRGVTAGPVTVFQDSTYQPDTTWRWMGSTAMDQQGNMALGYSASSASIFPQIRYAGRLVNDPINQMAQGEATLFAGTGSQINTTNNRWGDYSDMTVDPVDDCTFWYTQEYYAVTSSFNWRTRVGNFKFPGCSAGTPTPTVTGTPPTNTPTVTPTATSCSLGSPINEGFESGLGAFTSVVGTCVPGGCNWVPSANAHTGTGAAFAPDLTNISDQYLQLTNSISIPASTSNATLTFWHAYDMEGTYDGGVLEVSTDGGATWADVTAVGGIFNAGAYNGTISSSYGSPISGRQAWTGAFTTYSQVSVNLNALIGQNNVKIRFREANDNSVAHVGWYVDDVLLTLGGVCVTNTATNTPTNTAVVPTSTATNTPTNTAVVPTSTATNTPTNTAVVPTHTATNTPTNTAVVPTSTATNTPTNTAIVPTNTPSNTPTNTAEVPTNTPSNTPTNTAIIPTNTPSNTPTNTAVVPTDTPSNTPTDTPFPTATVCGISNLIDEGFEGGLGVFSSVVGNCVPGGCGWVPAGNPHSGSGSAFAPDLPDVSDQYLELTNSISIPGGSGSATLTFWHAYDMESTYDGGVLEVSINGGSTWVDVLDAGGSFISGGYDDTISTAFNSPIAGRQAWTGAFTTYRQVSVNLNSLIGQNNVKIRFREANDESLAHVGWNVDDVVLAVSDACGSVTATYTTTPTPTPVFTITPTNTPVPRTDTPTNTPSVTPTDTAIVPTDTPTDTPTGTRSPTDIPTDTPVVPPSSTSTGTPVSTDTSTPTSTSTICPLLFTDVPEGSTFYPFIRCLACRGIINGYSSGCETGNPCFRPENNVSRGQLSKIVSNSAGWSEDHTEQTYEDVAPGSTFHLYIERLSSRGIINGYPCGGPGEPCGPGNRPYFRPNGSATRGQIAKIDILAAVAALGWTLLDPATNTFEDVPVGSTFFRHIETAYAHGVLNGYPCGSPPAGPCQPGNKPYFVPNNLATRGQTSKIVANTFFPSCDTP